MVIYKDDYQGGTPIPEYIYGILIELAKRGYISKKQHINAKFMNKIKIEELINVDDIGNEVKKRLEGE